MTVTQLRTGVDLLSVDDVAHSISRFGSAYLSRLYTPAEQAATAGRPPDLARLYAVKEAVLKAIGAPEPALAWTDIEVTMSGEGRFAVSLTGEAARLADLAGIASWEVTASSTGGLAGAVAVARRES